MNIGQRVKELRKEKNLTQKKLAELAQMSENAIIKLENGQTVPSYTTIEKLIEIFDVSANELFNTYDVGMKFNYETAIARNIVRLRNEQELSQEELSNFSGVSCNVIKDIEKGKLLPSNIVIESISRILGVDRKEITKPDDFQRGIAEKDMLEIVSERKQMFEYIQNILNFNEDKIIVERDETGHEYEVIYSAYDEARDVVINQLNLKAKTLDELEEIYDFIYQKKLFEQSLKL